MRKVKGFSRYSITEDGEVYSHISDKYIVKTLTDRGYWKVGISDDSKKYKNVRVHRLVAMAYVSGYKEGLVVNHIDGNKLNNHYTNLEWTTQKKNTEHAIRTKLARNPVGETNNNAKITERQAIAVMEIAKTDNFTSGEISYILGISEYVIQEIVSGNTWTHLERS